MNQSCRVCGEVAAGYHFGAFTCEGCKSFFGRTYNNRSSIGECKNQNQCIINKKNRTSCKSCRLKKCFSVGMSKSGSRYGRRSNWFKIHCLLQDQGIMQQQQQQHQQQQHSDRQQQLDNMQQHQPLSIASHLAAASQATSLQQHNNLVGATNAASLSPSQTADLLSSMIAASNHHQQQHLNHLHQPLDARQQQQSPPNQQQQHLDLQQPQALLLANHLAAASQVAGLQNFMSQHQQQNHPLAAAQTATSGAGPIPLLTGASARASGVVAGAERVAGSDLVPSVVNPEYASAVAQIFAYCYLVSQHSQTTAARAGGQ